MNRFLLHLAFRALRRRRARAAITMGSIALGVAALTFLGGIMVGVNDAMVANSIALHTGNILVRSDNGPALVRHWRAPGTLPGDVRAALPRVASAAMLETAKSAVAVQLVGVVPEREKGVSAVPARVEKGRWLAGNAAWEVVLGESAARQLGAAPGDALRVRLGNGQSVSATVAGIFKTGIPQFDEGAAYAPLGALERVAPDKSKGEVALFAQRGVRSDDLMKQLKPLLAAGETATPWEQLLPELDQLTKLNVVSMGIVIFIVVVMLAAAVSNTTLVSVMDRYREFGVLKALGTMPVELVRLILAETAMVCLAAGVEGLALGCAGTLAAGRMGIDLGRFTSENPHFVLSSVVYPRLTWGMTVAPVVTVLASGLLASLWPAMVAARHRAAEVLRFPA